MIDIRYLLLVRDDERLRDVNYKTRLVLYALSSRLDDRGGCYPSQGQIAKDTNLSLRSVQRGINEAVECGFLTRDRMSGGKSNYYTFPWVEKTEKVINKKGEHAVYLADSKGKVTCPVGRQYLPSRQVDSVQLADKDIPRTITKEDSLSLTLPHMRLLGSMPVDKYNGTERPSKREHIIMIRRWCKERGMPEEKVREFVRINNLTHWKQVTQLCTVSDMIDNFIDMWKARNPEEYAYIQERRRLATRREEEERMRERIEKEG